MPKEIETQVLVASRRRCCVCYFVDEQKNECKGQIAHIDVGKNNFESLVYLCHDHHDELDSSRSQSKGLTRGEVRAYREKLYRELGTENLSLTMVEPESPNVLAPSPPSTLPIKTREERLHEPWHFWRLVEGLPELFAYKATNGCDGICFIELVDIVDGSTVIICEEVDGNPGQSITNAIEFIAVQLCMQFKIDPWSLILIEHYDTWYAQESEWNMVDFKVRSLEGFEDPVWEPMSDEDWHSLGFRPRKQRLKKRDQQKSFVVRIRRR